jgi:hypothetical protein
MESIVASPDDACLGGRSGSSAGINPAPLEIACIPWSAGSKKKSKETTINLALFFLARLALDDRSISTSYPPIDLKSSKVSGSSNAGPNTVPSTVSQYFISSKSISYDVIWEDIEIYIQGASVKASLRGDISGYLISSARVVAEEELIAVVNDLKADTEEWGKELNSASIN